MIKSEIIIPTQKNFISHNRFLIIIKKFLSLIKNFFLLEIKERGKDHADLLNSDVGEQVGRAFIHFIISY